MAQTINNLTETWNSSGTTFTGVKYNVTDTASAAASLLMDLQVGGVSKLSVEKTGALTVKHSTVNSTAAVFSSASSYTQNHGPTIAFQNGDGLPLAAIKGAFEITNNGGFGVISFFTRQSDALGITEKMRIASNGYVGIGTTSPAVKLDISGSVRSSGEVAAAAFYFSTYDLYISRDAANTLAQRNGTNAQTSRLYGTYTDASNYRRLTKTMSAAGVAEIKPEGAGTGATGNVLYISGLPTSNPGPGILWNNAGVVNVGT